MRTDISAWENEGGAPIPLREEFIGTQLLGTPKRGTHGVGLFVPGGQNGNPDRDGCQVKKTYRLNQEIQATVAGVEHRTLVTIPQGSIISMIGPVAEEPEIAEVLWDGRTVRMFVCDFTARTTAITTKEPKVTPASSGNTNSTPPKSEGSAAAESDAPAKVRRFTASGREL